ncbi:ribonuclease E inhibitor RraB [Kaarinaea lacus]
MIDPIGLVVAIIIAIFGYRYAAKKQQSRTLDGYTLKKFEESGLDLTKEYEIEFWFYADEESGIVDLGDDLENLGYQVYIAETEQDPKFVLRALKSMTPDLEDFLTIRKEFNDLARKHNAEYDNWGSSVL